MKLVEPFLLKDLAARLGAEYIGPPNAQCDRLVSVNDDPENALVICLQRKHIKFASHSAICGCVTTLELADSLPYSTPKIIVSDPSSVLRDLLKYFAKSDQGPSLGFHPTASIDPLAKIHHTVKIAAHCVLDRDCIIDANVRLHNGVSIGQGVHIGAGSIIHQRAVILSGTTLGKEVIIGPGCVIGGQGFSVDNFRLRPHIGGVEIGDFVSVGANSCVDQGTFGPTRIGSETHIDNLVQIGHNAQIGSRVTICGQVGIAGGVVVADGSVLGGQSGIAQGVVISKRIELAAQSGVTKDIHVSGRYSGHPAEKNVSRLRRVANLRRLSHSLPEATPKP